MQTTNVGADSEHTQQPDQWPADSPSHVVPIASEPFASGAVVSGIKTNTKPPDVREATGETVHTIVRCCPFSGSGKLGVSITSEGYVQLLQDPHAPNLLNPTHKFDAAYFSANNWSEVHVLHS